MFMHTECGCWWFGGHCVSGYMCIGGVRHDLQTSNCVSE